MQLTKISNDKFGEVILTYEVSMKDNDILFWACINALEKEHHTIKLRRLNEIRDALLDGEDSAFDYSLEMEKDDY